MKKLKLISVTLACLMCMSFCILPVNAALIGGPGRFNYYLNRDKTAVLKEYKGEGGEVIVPSTVYSYTVTEIADNAFSNNTAIEYIEIPSTVKDIGEYAFYGCTNLKKAVLPASVTMIKDATFYGCTKLEEIIIPASVTSIAANAFRDCPVKFVGEDGSYAEKYAKEHGFAFEGNTVKETSYTPDEPTRVYIQGDADGSGNVDSGDALSVLRMSVGLESYSVEMFAVIDIDGDGNISSSDALEILRFSVGSSRNDNIGKPIDRG